MSVPLRELFVELPRAVLETLQGAIEAEIRRVQPTPRTGRPSMASVLGTPAVAALVRQAFGLSDFLVQRHTTTAEVRLVMIPRCRHWRTIDVSETVLEGTRDLADLLSRLIERGLRRKRCQCVERPA